MSQPDEPQSLEVTRGMLVAIFVVMGLAWWSTVQKRDEPDRGFAFESWTQPRVDRIADPTIDSPLLGIQVVPPTGFSFFRIEGLDDSSAISFSHADANLVGRISRFDPGEISWPPDEVDFFGTAFQKPILPPGEDSELPASGQFRLVEQSVTYDESSVDWYCPRKSPSWPLRVSLGKCEIGDKTLLIRIYELAAELERPEYTSGAIAELARSIRPR